MPVLFDKDDTLNYKKWAVKARLIYVKKLLKRFPDDPRRTDWEIEVKEHQAFLES